MPDRGAPTLSIGRADSRQLVRRGVGVNAVARIAGRSEAESVDDAENGTSIIRAMVAWLDSSA